ncbi:FAD:protein FMN transferase [Nocardioides dilutus]
MSTSRFEAIGTYVVVATQDPGDLTEATRIAHEVLVDVDETCSRFRADSDLSRVNREPGRWVRVDPLLVAAVSTACGVARWTDGIVHPLLGRNLVSLGYDRDLGLLTPAEEPGASTAAADSARAVVTTLLPRGPGVDSWREIGLREDAVRIPEGTALDLGSTGKAWAADLIAAGMDEQLSGSAAVSVGGDVAVAGDQDWPVDVTPHVDQPPSARVWLSGGGLATSSTQVRRWTHRGRVRHHLVDPRTGLPAPEVWTTVTATGPSCVAANAASTASVVLGDQALRWLVQAGVSARLVAADGAVHRVGSWPESDAVVRDLRTVGA